MHPLKWPRHPIEWLVLPIPPCVVQVVCRTGKMSQVLQRITGDFPKLTHISPPSLPDSSSGLGIGYARSEQALVAQQKYKSSLTHYFRGVTEKNSAIEKST